MIDLNQYGSLLPVIGLEIDVNFISEHRNMRGNLLGPSGNSFAREGHTRKVGSVGSYFMRM